MLKVLFSAPVLFLLACSGQGESSPLPPADCAQKATQREMDTCNYDALLSTDPASMDKAWKHAQSIKDPVIQGAAVLTWVETHNRKIQADQGRKICRLLVDLERTACERRLYAAHLQR